MLPDDVDARFHIAESAARELDASSPALGAAAAPRHGPTPADIARRARPLQPETRPSVDNFVLAEAITEVAAVAQCVGISGNSFAMGSADRRPPTHVSRSHVGAFSTLLFGLAASVGACLVLTRITVSSTYLGVVLPSMILIGVAAAIILEAVRGALVRGLTEAAVGRSSGIIATGFQLGGAVAFGIVFAVFNFTGNATVHEKTVGYDHAANLVAALI